MRAAERPYRALTVANCFRWTFKAQLAGASALCCLLALATVLLHAGEPSGAAEAWLQPWKGQLYRRMCSWTHSDWPNAAVQLQRRVSVGRGIV